MSPEPSQTTSDQEERHCADLLTRVAGKDREAFSEIYDRFCDCLHSISTSITGSRADADDVLQETMLKVWKRAGKYNPDGGRATTWLITLCRNTALDKIRSSKSQQTRVENARKETHQGMNWNEDTSLSHLLSRETNAKVRLAMRELPEAQRVAIELAFFQGLTHLEVADALSSPVGTIKARIRRGMMHLRGALEEFVR